MHVLDFKNYYTTFRRYFGQKTFRRWRGDPILCNKRGTNTERAETITPPSYKGFTPLNPCTDLKQPLLRATANPSTREKTLLSKWKKRKKKERREKKYWSYITHRKGQPPSFSSSPLAGSLSSTGPKSTADPAAFLRAVCVCVCVDTGFLARLRHRLRRLL